MESMIDFLNGLLAPDFVAVPTEDESLRRPRLTVHRASEGGQPGEVIGNIDGSDLISATYTFMVPMESIGEMAERLFDGIEAETGIRPHQISA